ncbi:MAG: GntG family PLP-dependent aldolase [Bacteroidota bacterium]
MIDLRSDTVTKPDKPMLKAMMSAETGDDVYGEDPTINKLQEEIAELTGKEDALFVPSGSMGNQICVACHTEKGDEVILESQAHIFYYETGAPALISSVQLNLIPSDDGMPPIGQIEDAIRPDTYYLPRTSLICLENTHNRHSGSIISQDYIKEVRKIADKHGLKMHLDGARLWNASAATGMSIRELSEPFDSVSLCFSKGLGAPVGSIICGSKKFIKKALKMRKILGGGMRQAGILAAGAGYALKHNLAKLEADHINAGVFAERISACNGISINMKKIQTNIVLFDLTNGMASDELAVLCRQKGLAIIPFGPRTLRAVFHHQVTAGDAEKAADIICAVLER